MSYSSHLGYYRKKQNPHLLLQDFATPSLEFTELQLDADHEDEEEHVEAVGMQFCLRRHWETRYKGIIGYSLICGVLFFPRKLFTFFLFVVFSVFVQ